MRLNKIKLNNIRSYENLEIDFPEGSTLLSGDIGSGKTSVLLAIEFALFGLQPGQKGTSLLKNGEDYGRVFIEFEVEKKEISIERTLKRGNKSITQDYCAITIDGEKKEVAVTELKNLVLEILDYPKEFSKKQNLLYKFTVYTPQEEMKQIILQDPETRINTLRHVFGVDKYKKIIENTSIVLSKIREEKRVKEALLSNFDKDRAELEEKENELEDKRHNLSSIEKELFSKKEARKKIQEEREEISKKKEEKTKVQSEIEKTKIMISNKKESIENNNQAIKQLQKQIDEMKNTKFDEEMITQTQKEISVKKEEREKVNEEFVEKATTISSLNMKNDENGKLKERLSKIEICPTCLQNIEAVYKSNVLNDLYSKTTENTKKIESLSSEKAELSKKLNSIDDEIKNLEEKLNNLKILSVKFQNLEEKKSRIEELEKHNSYLEKDNKLLEEHLDILKNSVFELSKYDSIYEKKSEELDNALKEERAADIKVAELKKEIDVFLKSIEDLTEKINKNEKVKESLNYLSELETWITKKFIPIVSHVERNVMIKLKKEFSQLFEEWFGMLVSENFNVYISDDFTPIIEQQDYEIDYAFLSGGERTAVALAYRLALNQVINSLLSRLKTKDLVILDEPTDGFSENQLDKMRDVLQQLNVGQLIIVSHEQKIEGFVDNVIKLKKDYGTSKVVS